jgi:hypothetical protein
LEFRFQANGIYVKQEEGLTRRREDAKKSDLRVFFLFAFFLFTLAGRAARGISESKAKTRRKLASFHFALSRLRVRLNLTPLA